MHAEWPGALPGFQFLGGGKLISVFSYAYLLCKRLVASARWESLKREINGGSSQKERGLRDRKTGLARIPFSL